MLTREHLSRASDAGLHFIEDQQNAVTIAQLAQPFQESIRRYEITAFTLNRLDHDRGNFRGGNARTKEHVLDVVEHRRALILAREQRPIHIRIRHMRHARHRREETLLLRVLARRECQRSHAAPMKAAEESDEARTTRDVTRELQRTFDGFRAALAEKAHHRLAHRIDRVESLGERRLPLVPVVARDMQKLISRILDRLHDMRMTVTGRAHSDARREIEKPITVDIPHFGTPAVRHHERIVTRVGRRSHAHIAIENRLCLRSR